MLELFILIFSVRTQTAVIVKPVAFFGFRELGQFCKVLFKLSKEGLGVVASSVVTVEHVCISHVAWMVMGKFF